MLAPTLSYLTSVYFKPGAIALLGEVLASLNVKRPLIVTDAGLVVLGLVERLPLDHPIVFADVESNPTESSVLAGLSVYREQHCDGVVGLGGGSPMDCGKAIALLATHAPPLGQYALIRGGVERITANKPPFIAVPTTAGTGSEVGRGALVTMTDGQKLALISPHLVPHAAVCDPDLTLDLPPLLTAATGFDAISHCVETWCSPTYNPVADAIALDGLIRAVGHIRTAVRDGRNIAARTEMLMSAIEGGLTFQKGLGLIHSLSHPLGGLSDKRLHHGTLNAVLLPHVLRFNMPSCREKMDAVAGALVGVNDGIALPAFFESLSRDVGLPVTLGQMGVTREDLAGIPEAAMRDHCHRTNPRTVKVEDCRAVLEAAL